MSKAMEEGFALLKREHERKMRRINIIGMVIVTSIWLAGIWALLS